MSLDAIIGIGVSVLILVYLTYSLLRPEKFS